MSVGNRMPSWGYQGITEVKTREYHKRQECSMLLSEPSTSKYSQQYELPAISVRKIKNKWVNSLMPTASLGEQMAADFLSQKTSQPAPNAFAMQTLAQQLPRASSSSQIANAWTSEFNVTPQNQLSSQWASQFTNSRPMESAWNQATSSQIVPHMPQSTSADSTMWSAEFLDGAENTLMKQSIDSSSLASSWSQEYSNAPQEDFWGSMQSEWDAIQRNVEMAQGDSISNADQLSYTHEPNNVFINAQHPQDDGDKMMTEGDLGGAIRAYEAAVQQNPQDAERLAEWEVLERMTEATPRDPDAWCRLGLARAENEHDSKAIVAFNNCLNIQPDNSHALLSLSVSLANESMDNKALEQLDKWLNVFEGKAPASSLGITPTYSSFLDGTAFEKVESRFLEAARRQAAPDADLQNALGVLYNLNRNFERAVESLQLAISTRPEDARLWNRLGATLANGDRTADAISAYREALTRYPTYVRARYNLGISCMHLTSYREAVEHFVSALELQKGEGHSIWPTLRSATIRMKDATPTILEALDRRDLNTFRSALRDISST